MDVGLDEIIKKKWKNGLSGRRNRRGKSQGAAPVMKSNLASGGIAKKTAKPVIDARVKIIARQRKTLRDAREKLNALHRKQDARVKLSSAGLGGIGSRLSSALIGNTVPRRTINNTARLPRPAMDTYSYERRRGALDRLYRTIDNELIDPMEVERPTSWDPVSLPQLEVRLTRPVAAPPSTFSRQRELRREDSWLKPSILRRDDGIKSRLEPIRQEEGYRIVVSNLQPTVTHEDIKELFEDIGPLIGSRVVRPGTAEVVYREFKDAVAAVDTYHNRQLDGQPMKCLLVKPTSSSKGVVGTKGSVVPDIVTIHKALFMK